MSSSAAASAVPTVGLDIGGTKVLGVLLDAEGNVLREQRRLSPHAGVDALVETAAAIVDDLAESDSPVGVGAAGLVNHDGHVLYSPNLPTVHNAPLREALVAATHHPLIVDNDANVAARGEVAYGAAKGVQHALLVTLGTGIGGGLLLNGQLYRGAHGFGAEIGHITVERDGPLCACGERGHWEAIASGTALGRMARELVKTGGERASSRPPAARSTRSPACTWRRRRVPATPTPPHCSAGTPTTSRSASRRWPTCWTPS